MGNTHEEIGEINAPAPTELQSYIKSQSVDENLKSLVQEEKYSSESSSSRQSITGWNLKEVIK